MADYHDLTDKFASGFGDVYPDLLAPYVEKDISLLEIGVDRGGSLLWFQSLLPKARICGIDDAPRPPALVGHNEIHTGRINQNNSIDLDVFAAAVGGFDIIIDDGSHFTRETETCFNTLWDRVKPGGFYIVEDWGVALNPYYSRDSRSSGMAGLVFDIASRKVELGITAFCLSISANWCCYALFRK